MLLDVESGDDGRAFKVGARQKRAWWLRIDHFVLI
jgi:hypothetical protein